MERAPSAYDRKSGGNGSRENGDELPMTTMVELTAFKRKKGKNRVFFSRQELRQLLDVYSRRVALGEWRDYAIDHYGNVAVFSVFRHSFDSPLYAVAKSGSGKECEFVVFDGRQRIKRGLTMAEVLKVFEKPLRLVSAH